MLPKLLDVPISTYLMVLAKIRRPSATPSASTSRSLLQQDDVGGVLGDVGARVDRDADVGGVQRERVVDAVAEEGDPAPLCRCARTMRALCSGLTRAKTVVAVMASTRCVVVEGVEVRAGEHRRRPAGRGRGTPWPRRRRCRR